MTPRAVTFDLDNTLTVVEQDRETILHDAATAVGAPPLSRESYLEAHETVTAPRTREPIFTALLSVVGATDVDPTALTLEYRRRIGQNLRPVRGVEELLDNLGDSMPVGLITNGPERAQWDKLERLGWTDRFDAIVISGRVGADKPHPTPFHAACDRLSVDPGDVVHIGDHPVHDVTGARRAGLEAIRVVDSPSQADPSVESITRERLAEDLPMMAAPAIH